MIQLVAAQRPFAFARYLRGKISLTYTHAVGPLNIRMMGRMEL